MSLLSRLAVSAARAYGILSSKSTNVSANFLVVAGGAGGGGANSGNNGAGGGGAGGFRTSAGTSGGGASAESAITLSALNTYTITVGAGGAAATGASGNNGSNSIVSGTGLTTLTSTGGGGGAIQTGTGIGKDGGSGGGGASGSNNDFGSGTANQGYRGGSCTTGAGNPGGGGGGGAGAVGGNGINGTGGNGGTGVASSISGSSVTYAGGGGAGVYNTGTAGTGGSGGGGNGNVGNNNGSSATANTGGGGGGSGSHTSTLTGGAGGSGIVIISYTSATPRFVGGTLTTSGGNQIHTFTSSGTLSPLTPVTASYLVVAGGGGGGRQYGGQGSGGGGGAGGLLTSSTTLYSGATYVVTVGAGGAGGSSAGAAPSGSDSSLAGTGLTTVTSTGGGGGAGSSGSGASGGSGGGGQGETAPKTGGAGTSGQGFAGGTGAAAGGGGGGASAVGANATTNVSGGNGGAGTASSISGTSVTYAGGGGGGGYTSTAGTGGAGGGASGQTGNNTTPAGSGTPNLGGGGGGAAYNTSGNYNGGAGGSGVVIISYAGSQVFNGGLVTSSGGNTIHTFNATGALTPLTNNLTNSLRFRSSASAYLSRTPSVTGNQRIWTWSSWVKRGTLTSGSPRIYSTQGASSVGANFSTTDTLNIYFGGSAVLTTTQVFRDPSAWYHIVVALDTTQATAANRVKLYINGNQVTAFGTATYPSLNDTFGWNNGSIVHQISASTGDSAYFDGYQTDINVIDGQALEPYYFGNNDAYGNWKPILYKGTYGTNGFYLTFSDTSALTTSSNVGLGKDFSGNGNYFATNNISITAGTTYDAMLDVPTNTSATVANYAVWNPLSPTGATCADGNLQATITVSGNWTVGTFAVSSEKYYFECVLGGSTPELAIGIAPNSGTTVSSNALHYYSLDGKVYSSNSVVATGATFTSGDIIGVAFEPGGNAYFYKNNTLQATVSMPAGSDWCAEVYQTATRSNTATVNFGQRPFSYTPPSGYVALNTYNLPTPTILQGNKYMDATLYTQNGAASNVIVNAGQFKPDLVWIKCRTTAGTFNNLVDSVRGASKALYSNSTSAEGTDNFINTFNSNGFTLNIGDSGTNNTAGRTQVAWNWQAGQSSGSSNTSGTITSTVSVSTTAGFSVVTYTGNGGTGATVGHGLGVAPKMVIVKQRSGAESWVVGHQNLTGWNYIVNLNSTAAQFIPSTQCLGTPTSTNIVVGPNSATNANTGTYVAYCWAEIAGFSAFGSYTGNGSADGPFVYTGFRPEFVLIKRTNAIGNWILYDTARNTYNLANTMLFPNTTDADDTSGAIDILSNGFKTRSTNASWNGNGDTYIFMAFAENPFKNANAR